MKPIPTLSFQNASSLIALAAGIGIVFAFFMPWVLVDAELAAPVGIFGKKVDQVTHTRIGSSISDVFRSAASAVMGRTQVARMSGFEIARSERNEFLRLGNSMMAFVGQKTQDPRQLRLLYLLPLIGLVLSLFIAFAASAGPGEAVRLLGIAAGAVALVAGLVMLFKLLTTPLQNELAKARLLWGLWTTVALFLVLGAAGLTQLTAKRKS